MRACDDLGTADIYFGDWILTRQYPRPAPIIAEDAEELLFLLRLFRPGELAFVRLCVNYPSTKLTQHPYRVISPLLSNSSPEYRLDTVDIDKWLQFSKGLQEAESWRSAWVRASKRFFLYGSSVEFHPDAEELDRIVNYMMALEAVLVPEKDFVSARLKQRALALVKWDSDEDEVAAKKALSRLYSVRSTIAHGGRVEDKSILQFLGAQRVYFESLVRQVLQQAILQLPATDESREPALNKLFAVTDKKRADDVSERFQALKDQGIREALLTELQSFEERSRSD